MGKGTRVHAHVRVGSRGWGLVRGAASQVSVLVPAPHRAKSTALCFFSCFLGQGAGYAWYAQVEQRAGSFEGVLAWQLGAAAVLLLLVLAAFPSAESPRLSFGPALGQSCTWPILSLAACAVIHHAFLQRFRRRCTGWRRPRRQTTCS